MISTISSNNVISFSNLKEITEKIILSENIQSLFRNLDEIFDVLLPNEFNGFYVYNNTNNKLELISAKNFRQSEKREAEKTAMQRHPGYVFKTGKNLLEGVYGKNDVVVSIAKTRTTNSRIYVPLIFENERIGVIGLTHSEINRYNERDLELLEFIASIASITYKRLEAVYNSTENLLKVKSLLDNTNDGVFIVDAKTQTVSDINSVALEILNKKKNKIIGVNINTFLPEHVLRQLPFILNITNNGKKEKFELSFTNSSKEIIYTEITITNTVFSGNKYLHFVINDISDFKRAQLKNEELNNLYTTVLDISSALMEADSSSIVEQVNHSLSLLGNFVGVDRVYIFDYNKEKDTVSNTFEWCSDGTSAEIDNLQDSPFGAFPRWKEKFFKKQHVYIPLIAEIPDEYAVEKETFEAQGIISILAVPIFYSNQFIGFGGFDAVKNQRSWSAEYISLLKVAMNIIISSIHRIKQEQETKKTKEFYEVLLAELPNDIAVFDSEQRYLFVNKKGIQNDEIRNWIIGKTDFDYAIKRNITQTVALERRRKFNDAVINKKNVSWNENILHKDKIKEVINRNFYPVFNEDRSLKYVIGYGLNSTDIFKLEKKQNQLLSIFENIPATIIHYSNDNEVLINDYGKKQLGIAKKDSYVPSLDELHNDEYLDIIINKGIKAVNKDGYWKGEVIIKRRDGSQFNADEIIVGSSNTDDDKGISLIIIDTTERKIALDEIKSLSTFPLENPNPVLRFNADGEVLFSNNASKHLLEYWRKHFSNTLPAKMHKQIMDALFNNVPYKGEIIAKDLVYSYNLHPNIDKGYCNLYAEDITERKKQEDTLKQTDILLRSLSESAAILLSENGIEERINSSLKIIGINTLADYCSFVRFNNKTQGYNTIYQWNRNGNFCEIHDVSCVDILQANLVSEYLVDRNFFHITESNKESFYNGDQFHSFKSFSAFAYHENEENTLILTVRFNDVEKSWRDFEKDVLLTYIDYVINIFQKEKLIKELIDKQHIQKALLDASPDNIMLINAEGVIVEANHRYKETLNVLPEKIIGKDVRDLFSGKVLNNRLEYGLIALATKKPVFFEDSRDGYYFETCIHPVLNNNEEVIYFATYARDITSRKNTEQEIQLSKQKLESIFNEIQDVVWSVSTSEDAYILMTPSAEKLYGYSLQDFTEDRNLWEKVIHPDDKHIIPALEKKLAEAGFTEEEYRIITKSGEIKWIRNRTKAIYNHNNELIRLDGYTVDISERKKYETEIKESEENYRTILENSSEMIQTLDVEGRIMWANRSWKENLGVADVDITGEKVVQFLDSATLQEFSRVIPQLMKGNVVTDLDCVFISRKGNQLRLQGRAIPLYKNGNIVGSQAYLHDITKIKVAEFELEQLNENLEELVATRTNELNESNINLQNFSYLISHDLKAPVRHTTMFANMLKTKIQNKVNDDELRLLNNICLAGDKMANLIDGMLEFNKIGNKKIEKKQINTTLLVSRLVEMHKALNAALKINFIVDELPFINADESLMEQVFSNLISNAIKYSSKCEEINVCINYKEVNHFHEFTIKDNGVGFSMKHTSNLFNMFTRLHSPGDFEGNGIGLANSKRIIEKHKGTINFYSEPNKGAIFYFTIPK